jgi:hypothetical protein
MSLCKSICWCLNTNTKSRAEFIVETTSPSSVHGVDETKNAVDENHNAEPAKTALDSDSCHEVAETKDAVDENHNAEPVTNALDSDEDDIVTISMEEVQMQKLYH